MTNKISTSIFPLKICHKIKFGMGFSITNRIFSCSDGIQMALSASFFRLEGETNSQTTIKVVPKGLRGCLVYLLGAADS